MADFDITTDPTGRQKDLAEARLFAVKGKNAKVRRKGREAVQAINAELANPYVRTARAAMIRARRAGKPGEVRQIQQDITNHER